MANPGDRRGGREPDERANEAELAAEMRRGAAWAVETVRRRVRRIVGFRGYAIPAEDRRDLEQEIVAQIWRSVTRSGFDTEGGFWGFVEVVAARRCIDWMRRRRRESVAERELADPARGPLAALLAAERVQLAREAVARLDRPCRELVQMRLGHRRPYRELAKELGKSEGALRVRMVRCLREARRIFDELTAEDPERRMR